MTASEQLLDVLARAAKLPATVSLSLDGSEEMVRHLATLAGAQVWGILAIDDIASRTRIVWSVTVELDGLRVTAALQRAATDVEIDAVKSWQRTDMGNRTGFLRRLVGEVV